MRLKISKSLGYQFLFFLCVAIPYLNNYELTFFTWVFTFVITLIKKYDINFLTLLSPFVIILIISILVSFQHDYSDYYRLRDVTYLIKPVIGFLIGYQLFKKTLPKKAILLIIYTGTIISFFHLLLIINAVFVERVSTVAEIRFFAGYFSDFEIYTLILILFHKQLGVYLSKKSFYTLFALVAISSFLYLARTNFIQFLVLFLALKGYFTLTKKSITIFSTLIVLGIISYSLVLSTNPRRSAKGFEGFLYKIKVAPLEPFKTKINRFDYVDFNDNYRSYENIMTVKQVTRDGFFSILFGKGVGSKIDLKQEVYLGDMKLRFISILHNGFMIVFLKSGLLGIVLYLYTIYYFFIIRKSNNEKVKHVNRLFLGTGIFLFISNWVFLGFYNLTESKSILMGFLIAYRNYILQNENNTFYTSISGTLRIR